MGNVKVDGNFVVLLKMLRDRLADDPAANVGRLPMWMPDGSAVSSLRHVEAVLGMSQKAAAIAVLQADVAPASLISEAKDVYAGQAAHSVGVGIGTRIERRRRIMERAGTIANRRRRRKKERDAVKGLYPPQESEYANSVCIMLSVAAPSVYAIPGGTPPDDIHVTLAWYGQIDPNDERTAQDWIEGAKRIADKYEVFMGAANGITRFSMAGAYDDSNRDPIVVNVDAKEIEDLRQDVLKEFGPHASDHGFTPHMTLCYIDSEDPMPIQRYDPQPIILDGIIVAHGPLKVTIPFRPMGSDSGTSDGGTEAP